MIRSSIRRLRDERGFTVTEMVTTVAVVGVLLATFSMVMTSTYTHSTQEQAMTTLQNEARAAMERFAAELRQAYYGEHHGTERWPIESVNPTTNEIRFFSPDRAAPFRLRSIQWRLSGDTLQRRSVTSTDNVDTVGPEWDFPTPITNATWVTQAESIRNPTIFQFLNGSQPGAATTVASDVRQVVITLEVSTDYKADRKYTYTTSVTPRVSKS